MSTSVTERIAERLSNKDLETVRSSIEEILSKADRTKAADVFQKVNEKITLSQTSFCQALSANIASGRLSGYYSVRGPFGGIFKGSRDNKPIVEKPVVEKPVPKKEIELPKIEVKAVEAPKKIEPQQQKPAKKTLEQKPYLSGKKEVKPEPLKNILYNQGERFYIVIGEEKYSVPCHFLYIKMLLNNVFFAKEDPNGNVKFQDKIYIVEDTKKLGDLLLWFLNTSIILSGQKSTKEPVLNIVEDEPVVLSPRLLSGTND